ncbi:MAG: chemotaxis protein CheW [Alphaproteobacteria bacterium]|jgi:purine-binding chemotaxis protein CheW
MENAEALNKNLELISFRIGEQEFCLDIMAVREIRGGAATTPLPHSPDFVLGVINLRGAVLPIIDLKARLGLGKGETTERSVVIVVRIGSRLVGLLVDAVSEILAADPSMIQPTPSIGCDTVTRFVRGILTMDGRMVSWIALDEILPVIEEAEAA